MTHVVMPIAYEFAPDLVLVSAGTHAHARTHACTHTHACSRTHARTLDRAADRSCGRRVRCGRGRPARRPQRVAVVLRRHDAHAHDACEWQGRGRARGRVLHSAMLAPVLQGYSECSHRYSLSAISASMAACVSALLGDPPSLSAPSTVAHIAHARTLQTVRAFVGRHGRQPKPPPPPPSQRGRAYSCFASRARAAWPTACPPALYPL